MDGRLFRRWCLFGGLLAGATGCNRNTYHDTFGLPKAGQPVSAVAPGGKPNWAGGTPPAPGDGIAGSSTPIPQAAAPAKKKGTGFSPETKVAFADTWVEAALADPPPTNRDQLIDQARQAYQKVLEKEPKNKAALVGLARLHARLNDRERALDYYTKYLKLHPKDADAAHEVAITHGRWKDWEGAVAWCDHALKGDPQNRTYRKTKGFCLARAGRWEEAFETMRSMMPDAEAHYHMARVLDHQNHPDHCRMHLQMAVEKDPNYAQAREFLADLDQPRTTPNTPEAGQVLPAGYVQPTGQ